MSLPTIVFDLDGTLVDTAPDLVATLNTIFARAGIAPIEYALARNMVGRGARVMIERGLAADRRTLPAHEVDRMLHDFIEHYAVHMADKSRPFPGVAETLSELSTAGYRLAVCTNKLEWLSVKLLGAFDLSPFFAAICGADTFGIQKPDPRILLGTIDRAGGRPDRAVMVGDSATDVATARAARVPAVGVDFGYSDLPMRQIGPDRLVCRFSDIPGAISALTERREADFPEPVNGLSP